MAKKQTRRTVSLNRSVYAEAKQEAARRGVTLSALVEAGLSAIGVPVVAHTQQTPGQVSVAVSRKAEKLAARGDGGLPPSRERQLLGDDVADACGFQ